MEDRSFDSGSIARYFLALNRGEVYPKAMEQIEKTLIEKSLELSSGNQIIASRMLGMHRNTLRAKIKKLNIDVERFK